MASNLPKVHIKIFNSWLDWCEGKLQVQFNYIQNISDHIFNFLDVRFFFLYCSYYSQQGFTNPASPQEWRPLTSAADSGCQTHANIGLLQGQVCLEGMGHGDKNYPRTMLHIQSPTPASYRSWGSLWILGSQTHLNIRTTNPKPSIIHGSSRALWVLWCNYEFHHGQKGHVYFTLLVLLIKGLLVAKGKAMLCDDGY